MTLRFDQMLAGERDEATPHNANSAQEIYIEQGKE